MTIYQMPFCQMTILHNCLKLKMHHVGIAPTSKQKNGYLVCISASSYTSIIIAAEHRHQTSQQKPFPLVNFSSKKECNDDA
jgi:hypothetical protein